MAARAGLSQPEIARFEAGTVSPTWEAAMKLLQAVDARLGRQGVAARPARQDLTLPQRQETAARLSGLTRSSRVDGILDPFSSQATADRSTMGFSIPSG